MAQLGRVVLSVHGALCAADVDRMQFVRTSLVDFATVAQSVAASQLSVGGGALAAAGRA